MEQFIIQDKEKVHKIQLMYTKNIFCYYVSELHEHRLGNTFCRVVHSIVTGARGWRRCMDSSILVRNHLFSQGKDMCGGRLLLASPPVWLVVVFVAENSFFPFRLSMSDDEPSLFDFEFYGRYLAVDGCKHANVREGVM